MKALEIVTVTTFIAGICLAECIPLCALCFAISFGCGFKVAKEVEK